MRNVEAVKKLYKSMTGKEMQKEPGTLSEAVVKLAEDYSGGGGITLTKLFLTGDTTGISKSNAVKMTAEYVSNNESFTDECTLKWQGTSSLNYPKKNFTIKLGSRVDLGFGEQKKYCLKANYIDHSHARNIVSARLWSEIVRSRKNYNDLPAELRNSPNNGAINGYPVKLYLNGKYEGLYTLNIPKDAWMFNMNEDEDKHCVLCGEDFTSGCFRAEAVIDGTDWSDEIHDTVPGAILERWNEVIDFVMNSTDEEFKENIDNYIDLQSLIDYYIFAYASCGIDSMAKNQLYATYDGKKWYASMYDMDSTWGLYWNGTKFVSTEYRCQEDYESMVYGRRGNLLYKRLDELFNTEIVERYNELRKNVLSIKNIICKFEEFTDLINTDLYSEDVEIYTGIPSANENNVKQIRTFAKDRLQYVDRKLGTIRVKLTGIDISSDVGFNVGSKVDIDTTLTPSNANYYSLTYSSSASDVATVDQTGKVTCLKEGTTTITVEDSITGLSDTLDITVGAEIVIDDSIVFTLDKNDIQDGAISDIAKDSDTYAVTQEGTYSVDEDGGIVFDGTQSFMIDLSTNAVANSNVSRSFFVKFSVDENAKSGTSYKILGTAGDSTSLADNKLKWGQGHCGIYYLNNLLKLDAGVQDLLKESDNVAFEKGVTHNLISVYDATNTVYKLYLDGELVLETTSLTYAGIKICRYVGNSQSNGDTFFGKLYELSMYNKALSAEEIASLQ